MWNKTHKRRLFFLAALCSLLLLLPGCQLPSITAYQPGDPTQSMAEFINAVNLGDGKAINELLYDSHWTDNTDEEKSDADRMLERALAESRSFMVNSLQYTDKYRRRVKLSIRFTVLSLGQFEEELIKAVEEDVKEQMYEGIEISDTDEVINNHKLELLIEPQKFYTTSDYDVELHLSKGKWRIDLTDGFYNALLGISG